MQRYHIHFFDRKQFRFLVREWNGPDDLKALEEAHKLSLTHTVEVWQGDRRVARVERSANASRV